MKAQKVNRWDAVILGGGMAGLGAAVGLARLGRRVVLISKKENGASSPAAGGILDPFLEMQPGHPLFALSREAFLAYPALVRRLEAFTGLSAGYKKTGMLFIAMNHEEMRELENRFAWQKKTGIPVEWLSRTVILKKDPAVNPQLLGGLFYPTVARVNPVKLLAVIRRAAQKLGVQIVETSQTPELIRDRGQVLGVRLGAKIFSSAVAVNACGAWAGLGISLPKLPVEPAKGEIVMVRGRQKISTILHSLDGGYIVPWDDGSKKRNSYHYLLGSTVQKVGFSSSSTRQGRLKILQKNTRIMPVLRSFRVTQSWAGLRPFPIKKMPMIGPSALKGLYLAAGYYRSGILIGCRAGELLAKAIVSGRIPFRIQAFDPRQFSL